MSYVSMRVNFESRHDPSEMNVCCIFVGLVFGSKYVQCCIIGPLQQSININTAKVGPQSDSLHNIIVKSKNKNYFLMQELSHLHIFNCRLRTTSFHTDSNDYEHRHVCCYTTIAKPINCEVYSL